MNVLLRKLRTLSRRTAPTGSDILHLYSPTSGKDHYVLLQDVVTNGGFPDWSSSTTYSIGQTISYGLRLWKSLQNSNTGNVPTEGAWWTEVSASSKPDHTEQTVNTTAHGFVVKDVLYVNGSGALVKVTDPSVQRFGGLVISVPSANTYVLALSGYVAGLSGLAAGTLYYAQTNGTLGTTVTNMPVLVADTSTSGYLVAGGGLTSFDAFSWKNPCKAATTANITLSGTQTIDGISILAGDRVLVKDQTAATENGIYVCAAGAWSRATDANSAAELEGAAVIVQQGTASADTTWVQTTDGITLGSSNIVWAALATSVPDATETVKGKVELATNAEVITGTDTVRAVTPAGVKAATWYLTGTNTLGGATVVVGTASNTIKYQFDSLGTTQTNGAGLWLANTTAAAAGAQQISPSLVLEGQGWKTNLTAESQSVKWAVYVLPVQGAANPSAQLLFRQSINAGAYATYFLIDPVSGNSISGNESTTIQSNVSSTPLTLNAQGSSTGVLNLASSGVSRNRLLWSTTYALNIETPGVGIGGVPATKVAFQVYPSAHTSLTASTEQSDFIISGDRTVQWATGALTTQRFTWFKGATLAFVGASTVADAFNVYIDDLTAGTNATITNKYSLGLVGNLYVGGSITNGSGVLLIGTSTEGGTSRSLIAQGSGSNIDLYIQAKGTGVVIIDNMEVRASDYTGDKINLRDTSVSSRAYTRHFGSGNVSVTADYNSSQGCYDTSSLPNNTVIVLYVTFVVIKSDGSEAGSILMKTTWRKNNSGTLTKLSDKIIDSDEDAAGTLTLTSTNSGAVIQTNIVSSGGSGSFRYGIYIDRVIHSY